MKIKGGADHKNFYENLDEARMRLQRTVVTYDGEPYLVQSITAHKDGVFRMYLEPLVDAGGGRESPNYQLRTSFAIGTADGAVIDKWMEDNPKHTILRKKINSPAFNRFRPFPLGMINTGEMGNGRCYYIERQPQRQREQGLTNSMLSEALTSCGQDRRSEQGLANVNMYSEAFREMVVGKYPSAKACLDALMDSEVTNEALAFHRLMAFVRGPLDVIYLAYKDEIVGRLPTERLGEVQLGIRYRHLKEVITETSVFGIVRS